MAVTSSIYVKSFGTYNSGNGGPLRLDFRHEGTVIEDRTGDDQYARFLAVVDKMLDVSVSVRDISVATAMALGEAAADKTAVLAGSGDVSITFKGLVLYAVRPSANRASLGEVVLSYRHKSADGSAAPLA
jgi:hypothetical protein